MAATGNDTAPPRPDPGRINRRTTRRPPTRSAPPGSQAPEAAAPDTGYQHWIYVGAESVFFYPPGSEKEHLVVDHGIPSVTMHWQVKGTLYDHAADHRRQQPLLFPDGRLPSPRWRPVAWLSAVPVALLCGPIALLLRFRHARGVERQQLKWFVFAGIDRLLNRTRGRATEGGGDQSRPTRGGDMDQARARALLAAERARAIHLERDDRTRQPGPQRRSGRSAAVLTGQL